MDTNEVALAVTDLNAQYLTDKSSELITTIGEWLAAYGLRLVGALLLFFVGKIVAKQLRKLLAGAMKKAKFDVALIGFLSSIIYALMLVFLTIACLELLSIKTASLVTILGAAGLAVGLALQGSLANFAAGVLMIIFKPFKVGDVIDTAGVIGKVHEIEIFTTTLRTPDNKVVIIPNGQITSGTITNITAMDTRRVDLTAGCSYEDDLDHVQHVLKELIDADERILKEPAPTIGVLEMADSAIVFAVRPWTKTSDYWDVYYSLNKAIKQRFDKEGIAIPFPQMDVHIKKDEKDENRD